MMDEEEQMKTNIPTTREGAAAYLAGIVDVEIALVDTLVASGLVDRKALIERVQKAPNSELSCGGVGTTLLGTLEEGRNVARNPDGKRLGNFPTRKAAELAFFERKQSGTLTVEG
jgi:hypothetical protein